MFFEWYVRSWRYYCWILRASNGLGQLGLAKSRPLSDRFRGYSIGTPVLKSLSPLRTAYLCSFSEAAAYDLAQGSECAFAALCQNAHVASSSSESRQTPAVAPHACSRPPQAPDSTHR